MSRLVSPQARALLGKELRQFRRSRGAVLSATLLPMLLLVVMPLGQLFTLSSTAETTRIPDLPPGVAPPGLSDLNDPVSLYLRFVLPLLVTMGGLVVPSVTATYTVVSERERRSLDLLLALPVRVRDILLAKMLATLVVAVGIVLPLFAVDAAVLLATRLATPGYVALLLLVLLAALACAEGVALLLALLARDFRTANNLNGALIGPLIVASMALLLLLPGDLRLLALAGVLVLVAVTTIGVALRWLTFERYLA